MKGSEIDSEFRGSSNRLDVPIAPEGNHLARVYGVAYLGPIYNKIYNKLNNEFVVFVELLNKKAVFYEGQEALPYGLNKRFNWVGGDMSNMATIIAPMLGVKYTDQWFDDFDLKEIVGSYCTAQVVHGVKSDKVTPLAKLTTLGPWIDGVPKPDGVNKDFFYSVKTHGVWAEEWLRLPPWLRKTVFEWDYSYFDQIKDIPRWTKDSKPAFDSSSVTFLSHTSWIEQKETVILKNAEKYRKDMAQVANQDPRLLSEDEAASLQKELESDDQDVDDLPF